jgi:hypothetical protein
VKALRLGPGFSVPLDAVTQTFALLAKRGSGKTYTAAVMVEEMVAAGLPVAVLDPVGVLWGLRASADGKGPGLPVIILGGDHGDVPLEVTAGTVIADFVIDARRPVVLDLSLFRKGEQARFVTDFAERLYHKNREPLHLVIDEADLFAPQNAAGRGGLEPRMLGAIEDIVRRGRARGLGVTLITQRPAVLHKDVLTQVEVLIALRLIAPQDRAAIDAWVKVHGTPEQRDELMASLPSLPIGTAWFWSPGWLDVFQKVAIRKRTTFDSSATPKMGVKPHAPKHLAKVEIAELRERIASTIEKAKQEDPRELRRQLEALKRDWAMFVKECEAKEAKAKAAPKVFTPSKVPVFTANDRKLLLRTAEYAQHAARQGADLTAAMGTLLARVNRELFRIPPLDSARPTNAEKASAHFAAKDAAEGVKRVVDGKHIVKVPIADPRPSFTSTSDTALGKGEVITLRAIAQHSDGVSREQLSILTGYKRATRNTYLQRLGAAHLIEKQGDSIRATEGGIAALGGDFEPLPTGDALRAHWFAKLPDGESKILRILCEEYPNPVDREKLSELTEFSRATRNTYLQRLGARKLVETKGAGVVIASAGLFS